MPPPNTAIASKSATVPGIGWPAPGFHSTSSWPSASQRSASRPQVPPPGCRTPRTLIYGRIPDLHEGQLLLFTGLLLAAGLVASLAAGRLRLPGLVLVLGLGMLIGSDGLGWIPFDDFELARQAGIVAVALILFEGGLSSGFEEIRPVLRTSVILATAGTIVTAALTAVAAALILDLDPLPALLLGSTVAATDAAAVFAVLRGSTLRRRIARTLEGESGLNDPIAILLVIGCIEALQDPTWGLADAALLVVEELSIGFAVGLAAAGLAVLFLRAVTLPSAGLYP